MRTRTPGHVIACHVIATQAGSVSQAPLPSSLCHLLTSVVAVRPPQVDQQLLMAMAAVNLGATVPSGYGGLPETASVQGGTAGGVGGWAEDAGARAGVSGVSGVAGVGSAMRPGQDTGAGDGEPLVLVAAAAGVMSVYGCFIVINRPCACAVAGQGGGCNGSDTAAPVTVGTAQRRPPQGILFSSHLAPPPVAILARGAASTATALSTLPALAGASGSHNMGPSQASADHKVGTDAVLELS